MTQEERAYRRWQRQRRRRRRRQSVTRLALGLLLLLAAGVGVKKVHHSAEAGRMPGMDVRGWSAEGSTDAAQNTDRAAGDWALLLVNARHSLPDPYPIALRSLGDGHQVDARMYGPLEEMLSAMREQGLDPMVCSAYRTREFQQQLFDQEIQNYRDQGYGEEEARQEAAKWVAVPGTSEHQTGLAVDICAAAHQLLDEAQADTPEQQWLSQHCWEYGFILRFPKDKEAITGIDYESWHYRYVGKEAAKEISERGMCLEEYLGAEQ